MKFKLALGFVFLSFAVCAAVRTVTDLPPSPYADTEVSSNVVFNATRGEGQMDNVKWIFVSNFVKERAEKLNNIKVKELTMR